MSNNLRTRNGMPFNFVNGLKVRGMDIESLIPGIEGIPEAGSKYQFAGNGSNKVFTLPVSPYNKDAVDVYVKQLYVHPDDYTLVGDTVTLVEAPPAVAAGETYNVVIKVSLTTLNGYVDASRVSFEGENLDDILEKSKPLANYSQLRAYTGNATQVRITDPGTAGFFYYDPTDTTSADDGGTVIVTGSKRWKRTYGPDINVFWFMTTAQVADVQAGTAAIDVTAAIQSAINCAKTIKFIPVDSTSIRYGSKAVIFHPGVYLTSGTLLCDADVSLYCSTYGGAIIKYGGTGKALVVNSVSGVWPGPENTRVWEMDGVSILAENATHGVFFGASAQRHLTIKRGQVYGPQFGVYASEAVYFLGLYQIDVRGCQVGLFAGEYCDLLTVTDRCLFGGNSDCDIVLQCPTFHISNNDFEGGAPANTAIKIQHIDSAEAELRAGLIFDNRFGPESPNTSPPYTYDILIYDNGTLGAMDQIKIIYNKHFSYTDTRQKTQPVYVDGKVKRLTIDGNTYAGYASLYVGGNATKAFAGGTVVLRNFIDDILAAEDSIKGLFTKTNTKHITAVVSATTISKYSTLRYAGYTEANGFFGPSVGALGAGGSGGNYKNYAGIALHPGVGSRVIWITQPGFVLESTIDATSATFGDPVYMNGSALFQLSPINQAFPVGKILTATTNAKILCTDPAFQNTSFGIITYNPLSLADGEGVTVTVPVTGAAMGDFVEASFSLNLQGIVLTAWVSSADTVSVRFQNETGTAVDLSGGELRARTRKT